VTGGSVLRIEGLSKRFGPMPVLDGVGLDVAPGEFVALVGPSGVGKTTLFRCVTRLIDGDAGKVWLAGQPVHGLTGRRLARARRDIGVIFQQFNLVRRLSALDNVLIGRLGRVPTWRALTGRFVDDDRQRALAALDRVGLLPLAYRRADTLSGGQQQRVAIARALAQESRLILADEPVASLDPVTAAAILSLLRDVASERGIAVLCSLHQVDLAVRFADRVIGLRGGRLVVNQQSEAFVGAAHDRVFGVAD
jgi:phosphonate transport system ATP-binding protein